METPTDPHVKQAQAHLPAVSPSSSYQVLSRWLTSPSMIRSEASVWGLTITLSRLEKSSQKTMPAASETHTGNSV